MEDFERMIPDDVRWTIADGKRPDRFGPARTYRLFSPLPVFVEPGQSVVVNLGVRCSYPLTVFESKGMLHQRLRLIDGCLRTFDSDTDIVLTIKNEGRERALLETGDVMAKAFVVDNNLVEEEEE